MKDHGGIKTAVMEKTKTVTNQRFVNALLLYSCFSDDEGLPGGKQVFPLSSVNLPKKTGMSFMKVMPAGLPISAHDGPQYFYNF